MDPQLFRSQVLADAAHELRTPLAVMKSNLELVLGQPDKRVRAVKAVLHTINDEIDYLSRVVADLSLLTKSDQSHYRLMKGVIQLDRLIERVCLSFRAWAKAHDITIELDQLENVSMLADKQMVEKLVKNLLSNGVKYGRRGGFVKISISRIKSSVEMVVLDNGIGIPQEDLPYIFDRFYRVDKARSRVVRGSGLGLSICQWIVGAHHGTIEVLSTLGEGSRFIVRFPI